VCVICLKKTKKRTGLTTRKYYKNIIFGWAIWGRNTGEKIRENQGRRREKAINK